MNSHWFKACAAAILSALLWSSAAHAQGTQSTRWQIVGLNGDPTEGGAEIRFTPDGAITGSTGCNRFRSNGAVDGGALIIDGPVAATTMACPGEALTAQEDAILSLLQGRIAIGFDPFADELSLSKESTSLTLRLAPDAFAEALPVNSGSAAHSGYSASPPGSNYLGVFGVADPLAIRAGPSADAAVLASVMSGTVLETFGCVAAWCEVAALGSDGVRGYALAQYLEPANPSLRAGQGVFDAVGEIPCAQYAGQPMGHCPFGVARSQGGSATVVVRRPDGTERALFFDRGNFVSADTSEAGGGFDSSASREADLSSIKVDDERYEVPDAVIFGG